MEGLNPALKIKAEKILTAMALLGFPMFAASGRRSAAEQAALYAQGRTKPGRIVTNADGSPGRESLHQLGRALDCAFVDDPNTEKIETWDSRQPWDLYGLMAEKLGLRWGGRWTRISDRPHIELPPGD
jgi:peptidoglycan L-alanyl-D-glutamate endopeptidase CwlK